MVSAFALPAAAFADINIRKGSSVYYWFARKPATESKYGDNQMPN